MTIVTVIVIAVIVIGLVALVSILGTLYRKVGPNQALIVYGRGGTKVVVGGGTVVLPLFQSSQIFSLEAIGFDLVPHSALFSQQGLPVNIEAVVQLKVENEEDKILRAANQFLSKAEDQRQTMIRQIMEGHLRGIVGQLTVEQLVTEPEMVGERMRSNVASDLEKLGLTTISFTIKDVRDDSGYITNMSAPVIAANKQRAQIAQANADRDVAIAQANAQQMAAEAAARSEQSRVLAQTTSQAAQAEAQRDLHLKQADYLAMTEAASARAALAGQIATATAQRDLVAQQSAVELSRAEQQQKVQEAEAKRRQAELVATVQRPAEAQAQAERVKAEGDAAATMSRAQAEANSARLRGEAQASASAANVRETGKAEAETIRAKGLAEAEALEARTEALNHQAEPAIIQQAFQIMPLIARELGQAYARIGNVTYIGGGDGDGVTGKIARDVMGLMPAVGGMFESVTGVNLKDIFAARLGGTPVVTPASSNGDAAKVEAAGTTITASVSPEREMATSSPVAIDRTESENTRE